MTALDKQAREFRDKAGRFMLQKGVHMGDTIDAGLVQDWLVHFATQVREQTVAECLNIAENCNGMIWGSNIAAEIRLLLLAEQEER